MLVQEVLRIIVFSASMSGLASAIGAIYAYRIWRSPALLYWSLAWIASFLYGIAFGILLEIRFSSTWLRIIFVSNTLLTVSVLILLATGLRYSENGAIPEYTMIYWMAIGTGIPTVISSNLVVVYYNSQGRILATYNNQILYYLLVIGSFAALIDFSLVIVYLWEKGQSEYNRTYVILFILGVVSTILGALSAVVSNIAPVPKEIRFVFFLFIGPFILPLLIRRPLLLFRAGDPPVFIGISVKDPETNEDIPIVEKIFEGIEEKELEYIQLLVSGGVRALLDMLQNIIPVGTKKTGKEEVNSFELGLWNIIIAKNENMTAIIILEEKTDTYINALRYLLIRIREKIGKDTYIEAPSAPIYENIVMDIIERVFSNIDFSQYKNIEKK